MLSGCIDFLPPQWRFVVAGCHGRADRRGWQVDTHARVARPLAALEMLIYRRSRQLAGQSSAGPLVCVELQQLQQ